jgi:transposase-like protein
MGIHATQITQWKKQAQEGLKEVFADRRGKSQSQEPLIEQLYQNIARLQVELEWLQKIWSYLLNQSGNSLNP